MLCTLHHVWKSCTNKTIFQRTCNENIEVLSTAKCGMHKSIKLNYYLIASRMANYDWSFGTLPFGLFWPNLDTRDLETYPRTYSGHFWNVNFWRFQGRLSTFQKMGGLRKSKFSRWRSDRYPLISLVLGGEVPRLNHGPICCPIQNT